MSNVNVNDAGFIHGLITQTGSEKEFLSNEMSNISVWFICQIVWQNKLISQSIKPMFLESLYMSLFLEN